MKTKSVLLLAFISATKSIHISGTQSDQLQQLESESETTIDKESNEELGVVTGTKDDLSDEEIK